MKSLNAVICAVAVCTFLLSGAVSAIASGELSGKVIETMNSGGYTYALIESSGAKTWVAVPQTKIVKGQKITFKPGMEMENFESKTLKRKFDRIVFSDGVANGKAGKSDAGAAPSKGTIVVPAEKVKVEKAAGPNAYTVAGIFSNSKKLNKKVVSVRGKVVKFSSGIMGMNWLHIQDGTGNQKKGTHDLVVTTKETASVGDVVTASGKIAMNKDFGSNYKYKVIMENASLKK
ncbi:MAG: hypothetical protein M0Z71_07155 [Nitrospiraceae bacterium]|nr:hypothetical protein [Nitrospiraceae bacterium]